MIKLLHKISDISSKASEVISVILLLLMIIITCYQVFLRYALNSPTSWSAELSLIFLAWFGYLGIALGIKDRSHLSIDFLYNKMNQKYKNILDTFFYICIVIFSCMMIINGHLLATVTIPQKLPATGISKALVYLTLVVAGILMIIYSIQNIINIFTESNKLKIKNSRKE